MRQFSATNPSRVSTAVFVSCCARIALAAWRDDDNQHCPHSKLGWLTPAGNAARWAKNEEPEGRPMGAFDDDRSPAPLHVRNGVTSLGAQLLERDDFTALAVRRRLQIF
jgi:hypothetical protein